jgi:hypothetical protein
MTDTMTSQNADISSWDILYIEYFVQEFFGSYSITKLSASIKYGAGW